MCAIGRVYTLPNKTDITASAVDALYFFPDGTCRRGTLSLRYKDERMVTFRIKESFNSLRIEYER